MPTLRTLRSLLEKDDIAGKTVLLRLDLNVPIHHGSIVDDTRIRTTVPTIEALLKKQAKIVIISHFGRPKDGFDASLSLAPITDALSNVLGGKEVHFGVDCVGHSAEEAVAALEEREIILLENLRFHSGETVNAPVFCQHLAKLGDIYVNDAFACSHRAHASLCGIADYLPSYAGFLLEDEINNIETLLSDPEKPLAAVVGGAKVSTKLDLLESLVDKVDILAIGGGMANTFLLAQGYEIGGSLVEKNMLKTAKKILKKAEKVGCEFLLPEDVVVSEELDNPEASCTVVDINNVPKNMKILDIGPSSIYNWYGHMQKCKTIVWNGPLGAFEYPPYEVGSISLSRCIAKLTLDGSVKSIAGGGDIVAALSKARLLDSFTYISTAGGAFLEWLEGKELPGLSKLYD